MKKVLVTGGGGYIGCVLVPRLLAGIDYIINLAALSNDPMAELFEQATRKINPASRPG